MREKVNVGIKSNGHSTIRFAGMARAHILLLSLLSDFDEFLF